jgi:hypothetical protein
MMRRNIGKSKTKEIGFSGYDNRNRIALESIAHVEFRSWLLEWIGEWCLVPNDHLTDC